MIRLLGVRYRTVRRRLARGGRTLAGSIAGRATGNIGMCRMIGVIRSIGVVTWHVVSFRAIGTHNS